MHDIKNLRKYIENYKKKFIDRNFQFDQNKFESLDSSNRNLIIKKEKLEQEKKNIIKIKR